MVHVSLAPRYRLDDDSTWLMGIDPVRRCWLAVNGDKGHVVALPGLLMDEVDELRFLIQTVRSLQPGDVLDFPTWGEAVTLHCIALNCWAIEGLLNGSPVWHLFDQETLESLWMTAHPDWQAAPRDIERARDLISACWTKAVAA